MNLAKLVDFNTLFLSLCFFIFIDYIQSSDHLNIFIQNK